MGPSEGWWRKKEGRKGEAKEITEMVSGGTAQVRSRASQSKVYPLNHIRES